MIFVSCHQSFGIWFFWRKNAFVSSLLLAWLPLLLWFCGFERDVSPDESLLPLRRLRSRPHLLLPQDVATETEISSLTPWAAQDD
jgi:hypothetical protein